MKQKTRKVYNWIYHFFYKDNSRVPIIAALAVAISFVATFYLIGEYDVIKRIILYEVGGTALALFTITFASLAILLAISESTMRLSQKNKRWFIELYKIVDKFKMPIIVSLILALLHLITFPVVEILDTGLVSTILSLGFVVAIFTANIFLIILIGEVSLKMLFFIKAALSETDSGSNYEQSLTLTKDKTTFVFTITSTFKNAQSLTGKLADILGGIETDRQVMKGVNESVGKISDFAQKIVLTTQYNVEGWEKRYDDVVRNEDGKSSEYHEKIDQAVDSIRLSILDVDRTLDRVQTNNASIDNSRRVYEIKCKAGTATKDEAAQFNQFSTELYSNLSKSLYLLESNMKNLYKSCNFLSNLVGGPHYEE